MRLTKGNYETYKGEISSRVEKINSFLGEIRDGIITRPKDGTDIICANVAHSLWMSKNGADVKEALRNLKFYLRMIYGIEMRYTMMNAIFYVQQTPTEMWVEVIFYEYDQLKYVRRNTDYVFLITDGSLDDPEKHTIFRLMKYGVRGYICTLLRENGYRYMNDIDIPDLKVLKRIKGIANGQIRKIKSGFWQYRNHGYK